jgi:hypothetical protein
VDEYGISWKQKRFLLRLLVDVDEAGRHFDSRQYEALITGWLQSLSHVVHHLHNLTLKLEGIIAFYWVIG